MMLLARFSSNGDTGWACMRLESCTTSARGLPALRLVCEPAHNQQLVIQSQARLPPKSFQLTPPP